MADRSLRIGAPAAAAAFFLFLAGPAGSVRVLQDTWYFYAIRFAVIGVALFVSVLFFRGHPINIGVRHRRMLLLYVGVLAANGLVNGESLPATALQLGGVLTYIIFGVRVSMISDDRDAAIGSVVWGFVAANLAWIVITAVTLGPSTTDRFEGPFVTAHGAAEVFFGLLLVGVWLTLRGRALVGVPCMALSTWVTFLTGVRSSSLAAVLVIVVVAFRFSRESAGILGRAVQAVLFLGGTVAMFLATPEMRNRISGEDAMTIESEGRLPIWGFAAQTLFEMADGERATRPFATPAWEGRTPVWPLVLGVGTRASFDSGWSTDGPVKDEPIAWHNTWLALLIESGILGLMTHTAILFAVAMPLFRWGWGWLLGSERVALPTAMAALIAFRYVLASFTEMNLYTALSPGMIFFGTIFGVLASVSPESAS